MSEHAKLRDEVVSVWRSVIGEGQPVVLLGLPDHGNAGDILIWEGTRQALRSIGAEVQLEATTHHTQWHRVERLTRAGATALINGGGNLGDVWPGEEEYRRNAIQRLGHTRVIQLPQTARYRSSRAAESSRRVYEAHPDLTFMLRDDRSMAHFREALPGLETVYSPDAALAVDRLRRDGSPTTDLLVMARQDVEQGEVNLSSLAVPFRHKVEDWATLESLPLQRRIVRKVDRVVGRRLTGRRAFPSRIEQHSLAHFRRSTVKAIEGQLSQGRVVLTDRLHVHIACGLLGIPHVVVDNSYGKIRAIFNDYSHRLRGAHFAGSATEARQLVSRLQRRL